MKNLFVLLSLVFFGLACATAPVARQIQNAFPIDKPFEEVWQAMIETFSDLNLPILNMEKASGLITTGPISFRGQKNETGYCDCGKLSPLLETERDRFGKFNVYIKKTTDASCEVRINSVFGQAYIAYGQPTALERDCISTGKLEAEIFKRISEKIK